MTDTEKLEALWQYAKSLQASIELLEIKADFLESILPDLAPDLAARYEYYLFDRMQERKADPKSAIGILFADRE